MVNKNICVLIELHKAKGFQTNVEQYQSRIDEGKKKRLLFPGNSHVFLLVPAELEGPADSFQPMLWPKNARRTT